MAVIRVDPSSAEYRLFVDLYNAARATRPSALDRWNGKLYVTVGEGTNWGSLQTDGSFKLSKELVFDKLGPDATPQEQVQALTTIMHESLHARVEINAPAEPNAVLSRHSKALDEGLTEWVAVADTPAFIARAGFGELPEPTLEYPAAYHATNALLEYASGPDGASELAGRAIDAPVVMRWDLIADEIVKNQLADVLPHDPQHQLAARAELIKAMTVPGWDELDQSQPFVGRVMARDTTWALDQATQRIQHHYAQHPGTPYPATTPNVLLAQQQTRHLIGESQARAVSGGNAGPSTPRAARGSGDDAMRFLSGSPPAAQAVQRDLLDGAGSPAGASSSRHNPRRGTTHRRVATEADCPTPSPISAVGGVSRRGGGPWSGPGGGGSGVGFLGGR